MTTFTVNGRAVSVEHNQALIRYLRDTLRLTSMKDGCSEGTCGPAPSYRRQAYPCLHPPDRQVGGKVHCHGRGPQRV